VNGPTKRFIAKLCATWLSKWFSDQIKAGVDATICGIPNKKSDLVGPFCEWVNDAVVWLRGQQAMITRAWEHCGLLCVLLFM
jgi:hypothetical protein